MNEKVKVTDVMLCIKEEWHRMPLRGCAAMFMHSFGECAASVVPVPLKVPTYIGATAFMTCVMHTGGVFAMLDQVSDTVAEVVADQIMTLKHGRSPEEVEET